MEHDLSSKTIAILATHGFEESELVEPKKALEQAGAVVHVVSPNGERTIRGWNHGEWSEEVDVDVQVKQADPASYEGLVLPGGVINPDKLRRDRRSVDFVRAFFEAGKPVAAICHGPWMIVEAGAAKNRKLTSFHSIRTDMENAGARWVDEEVVVDQGLVTSRSPDDLPAFNAKMIEEFAEGRHEGQELRRSTRKREKAGAAD